MQAYYNILTTLKANLEADAFCNTVSQGDIFDIDLNKQEIFPLAHIIVNETTKEKNILVFNVTVLCMDIVDISKDEATDTFRGNDNEQDVLNTQLAVGLRLVEVLERGGSNNTFMMRGTPTFEPFTERFENNMAGWAVTFDIYVPNTMLACDSVNAPEVCKPVTYLVEYADGTDIESGSVDSGGNLLVTVPNPGVGAVGATLMKTGQTTSYATNDDGDFEAGRNVDFFTLPVGRNNPWGGTDRFTDELGTQIYANDIIIDNSTWNTEDNTVLGYYRTLLSSAAWSTQVANCAAVSIGSYTTGWRLTNHNEFSNIYAMTDNVFAGRFDGLNYAPFNISIGNYLWTSTSRDASFAVGHLLNPFGSFGVNILNKGNSYQAIACRTFTVTGTTLT